MGRTTRSILIVVFGTISSTVWAQTPVHPGSGSAYEAEGAIFEGFQSHDQGSGTLLIPRPGTTCAKLKVFFPGQAQELKLKDHVPSSRRHDFIRQLLVHPDYRLGEAIQARGCPVYILKDSSSELSSADLSEVMRLAGATELEVLAHSGGYDGLEGSLSKWQPAQLLNVKRISLLDNFYRPSVAPLLTRLFGDRLAGICDGFFAHSKESVYRGHFEDICPGIVQETRHKAPVKNYF